MTRARGSTKSPRVTKPYTDEQWQRDRRARPPGRRATCARGDVRLTHGRRADVRLDRRPRRRRVEHRRARPDQARARGRADGRGCATASRPAACCTSARASGIRASRCRAGRSTCYWRKDGEPIWHDTDALRRRAATTTAPRRDRGARVPRSGSPRASASIAAASSSRPTRTSGTTSGGSGGCRPTSIRSTRELDEPQERARLRARSSSRASDTPVGYVLPLARDVAPAGRSALDEPAVVPARRPLLPDPRRFADRLPPAARFAAVGRAPDDMPCVYAARPDPARTPLPPTGRDAPSSRAPVPQPDERRTPAAGVRARSLQQARAARRRDPQRESAPRRGTALCVEPRDGRLTSSCRRSVDARGLPRPRRRDRRHGARRCDCRWSSKATTPPHDPRLSVASASRPTPA